MTILRDLIYGGRGSVIVPTPQTGVQTVFVSEDTDDSVYLNYYNTGALGERQYIDSLQAAGGESYLDYSDLNLGVTDTEETFYITGDFKFSGSSDLALYINGDVTQTNYSCQKTTKLNSSITTAKTNTNSVGYSYQTGYNSHIDLTVRRLRDGTCFIDSNQIYRSSSDLYVVNSVVIKTSTISSLDSIRLASVGAVTFNQYSSFHLYKIVTSSNRNTNCITIKAPVTSNPNPAQPNSTYLVAYGGSFTLPVGINKDVISISDYLGSTPGSPTGFGLNALTIYPSGSDTIQGLTSLILNEENQSVTLTYYNGRWNITSI